MVGFLYLILLHFYLISFSWLLQMEKDSIFYIYRALEQKLLIIFGNTIYYTNLPVKTRN